MLGQHYARKALRRARLHLRSRTGRFLPVLAAAAGCLFAFVSPASAAPLHLSSVRSGLVHDLATSTNWSGYAVNGASFSDVSGSWVVPQLDCSSGADASSSFWVGIGGFGTNGLEQDGVEADCSGGQDVYSAWYEIIPAPSITVSLTVSPGDLIRAHVNVNGLTVTFELDDQTTGETFSQVMQAPSTDLSSAEWITEAPAACTGDISGGDLSSCAPVALANYGSVTYTAASAGAAGQTGAISAPWWTSTPIELDQTESVFSVPSPLSSDGTAFTTSWNTDQSQPQAPASAAPPTSTPSPPATTPTAPATTPQPPAVAPAATPAAHPHSGQKARRHARPARRHRRRGHH